MIGKVIRGTHAGSLLCYLYGPGRANEHVDPHLVAGFSDPGELEPERRPDGSLDFRRLAGLLAQPLAALAGPGYEKPVWHCAVRAAPGDQLLSDQEWGQVAAGIMDRTGLAPGGDELGVRWVAVRHAADHIHIVATLARQDGTRPRIWNDFYRIREACQAAERQLGLRRTAPADRTAARRPSRAETEQTTRRGWDEPPRVTLRREVSVAAAGASSEQDFFVRLAEGRLAVRQRYSTINPGQVTGYAVGMDQHRTSDGEIVWYGGGKLAGDLTLPNLRRRWNQPPKPTSKRSGAFPFTAQDQKAIYAHAARQAATAAGHIRRCARTDPGRAADAAWAAADVLHSAARAFRNPELRRAADAYERAARAPYGRIPGSTREGALLRSAARSLALIISRTADPAMAPAQLILKLVSLTTAVAALRQQQQHAAQGAAARRASQQLHTALIQARARAPQPGWPDQPTQTRPTHPADIARNDFPVPLPTLLPPGGPDPARPNPAGSRRPILPRRRAGLRQ